nr:MAG TPA: hypothetical protein [Caudoviricetes sp.]
MFLRLSNSVGKIVVSNQILTMRDFYNEKNACAFSRCASSDWMHGKNREERTR